MSQHSADPAASRPRWRIALPVLALAALAVAGCGGSKGTSSTAAPASPAPATGTSSSPTPAEGASGGALSVAANPEGQLAYSTKSLAAKAGKVTIDFSNSSPLSHNMTVESSSGSVVGATPTFQGGTKTLSLNLKPGTYKFFCTVPGHRQAGMEGTLVVK